MFPGPEIEKYSSTFSEVGDTLFALLPASDATDLVLLQHFRKLCGSDVSRLHNLGGKDWMKLVPHHLTLEFLWRVKR